MITLVRHRVRARPVSEQGRLAYGGYMELVWDITSPYEVRLAETGPDAGEVVFARSLLTAALDGDPAGEGAVRVRLRHLRGARHCLLVLWVHGPEGPLEFALCAATVARFVQATVDLVPLDEEWRHLNLDASLTRLLEDAA